jgi:hypothetical protein
MTIGRAFCRSAAISCDLRATRTGTGGAGLGGGSVWMMYLSTMPPLLRQEMGAGVERARNALSWLRED